MGLALENFGVNRYELCQDRWYSSHGPRPQPLPATGVRNTRPGRRKQGAREDGGGRTVFRRGLDCSGERRAFVSGGCRVTAPPGYCCSRGVVDGDFFHFQECPRRVKNYMVLLVRGGLL